MPLLLYLENNHRNTLSNLSEGPARSTTSEASCLLQLQLSFESDKIGVALNVAGLQLQYKEPRKTSDQCHWILAMIALSTNDATVLAGVGHALKLDIDKSTESCLRWPIDSGDRTLGDPAKMPERCCIECFQHDQIVLDIFMLTDFKWRWPSSESRGGRCQIYRLVPGNQSSTDSKGPMDDV